MDSNGSVEDEVQKEQHEVQISFPESMVSALEEPLPHAEQLESSDFSTVAYINALFPTEQSLSNIEAVAARCEYRASSVQHEMHALLRGAAQRRRDGHDALRDAQGTIARLSQQVSEINKKAERSEVMVREITSEIKQLDAAKSNLTAAITALNHYHMLVGGAAALTELTKDRLYREILLPLQACTEVLQHFESYRDIRQVGELRDDVTRIRTALGQQILADFREAFVGAKGGPGARTLADACLVVDALDRRVRAELVGWLVGVELQEYRHLFSAGEEAAWLDRVERRYAWLKRHLLAFEDSRAKLFPPAWDLSRHIAAEFCEMTRTDLSALMAARRSELDVKLLLYAIQKTYNFELLLHKRFEGAAESAGAAWVGAVGACFEPYLSLYIRSLDANLRQLMDRFVADAKSAGEAGGGEGGVLSSCADLFLFYKKCLVQCAQLSTGEPMLELAGVFGSYLREYAGAVLQGALPRGGAAGGAGGLVTNLHSLLREEGGVARLTRQEVSRVTGVITTAEYCLETAARLEQKLKEKIRPTLADRVDLGPERDLFSDVISDCIRLLVRDLEVACEPALQTMTRISWIAIEGVGDQSGYVAQIVTQLKTVVPELRDRLASSRKYFTQFCIRFANSFIPKFIQNIYRCKPISTVGSEQLLLDTHTVKTCLLELPGLGSAVRRPAPATYTRVVLRLMSKAEMILKLVMSPLEGDGSGFVSQVVQLLPECSLQEFRKVLDMKGLKLSRSQLANLDGLYRDRCRAVAGPSAPS